MIKSSDLQKGTVEYVRRRYVAIGASLVTLLAIIGEHPYLQLSFNAMGHLSVMLYVFFLSQVILRDRLLDLNEFIGRMTVMGILAVLFAAMFALLISLGNNFSSRLFNAVVGVMILLTLVRAAQGAARGQDARAVLPRAPPLRDDAGGSAPPHAPRRHRSRQDGGDRGRHALRRTPRHPRGDLLPRSGAERVRTSRPTAALRLRSA